MTTPRQDIVICGGRSQGKRAAMEEAIAQAKQIGIPVFIVKASDKPVDLTDYLGPPPSRFLLEIH